MLSETEFHDVYASLIKENKNPVVTVDATQGEVFVPRELLDQEGFISFQIGPQSVRHLKVKNDALYFQATFDGNLLCLSFPLANIVNVA